MRNGAIVMTADRATTTMGRVVEAMVGTSPAALFPPRPGPSTAGDRSRAAPSLSVDRLTVDDELRDVSFEARPGEIIGLAGLEGSGVATLLGVLFGTRRATGGRITFADGQDAPSSPTGAARRGISLVPADRRRQGLMLEASVEANIAHVRVGTLPARRPWLDRRAMRAAARRQIDALRIRADGPSTMVGRLSGGNQQKVVLAKWLAMAPKVLILDEPTRGIDVGAKAEIYRHMADLANQGITILMVSSDMEETIGMSDRVVVMHERTLKGVLERHELTQLAIAGLMTGKPEATGESNVAAS
jgi:ribose transport system ATP-binding protein